MGKIKILAIVGGLIALSTAVMIGWILFGNRVDTSEQLQLGLRLARKGDYATAAKLAQSLDKSKFQKRSETATLHFLVGAAARQTAELLQHRPSRTLKNEEAVVELQKSRELKFPPGYEGIGNYMLGMALYELFRWEEAIEPLTIASDRWPKGRDEAVERLIDIDLYSDHPNPESAMQRLERWSALSALTPSDVDRITVKRMEIHCQQGDHMRVEPLWQSIVMESPMRSNANLILARCLRQQAQEKDPPSVSSDRRQKAMSHLKEIDTLRNVPTDIRRRSMFEEGLLFRDSGETRQAVSAMSSLRLSSPFEP
nr:hypothetical protein [Pirellula sp.]